MQFPLKIDESIIGSDSNFASSPLSVIFGKMKGVESLPAKTFAISCVKKTHAQENDNFFSCFEKNESSGN